MALWSIFKKPLTLTLFPSIKNLQTPGMAAMSLRCTVHPVPPGLPTTGELSSIPQCSCLIFTLQPTAREDYQLLNKQIAIIMRLMQSLLMIKTLRAALQPGRELHSYQSCAHDKNVC